MGNSRETPRVIKTCGFGHDDSCLFYKSIYLKLHYKIQLSFILLFRITSCKTIHYPVTPYLNSIEISFFLPPIASLYAIGGKCATRCESCTSNRTQKNFDRSKFYLYFQIKGFALCAASKHKKISSGRKNFVRTKFFYLVLPTKRDIKNFIMTIFPMLN